MFGNLRGAKRTRNTAISHATKHMGIMAAVMPLVMAVTMAASLTALPTQASAIELPAFLAPIVQFLAGDDGSVASVHGETVVDDSTLTTWEGEVKNSTENVGRIWTDKTVQNKNITLTNDEDGKQIEIAKEDDADFLVGLSALSSTSNLTTITNKPLDIVLVLDISDSMQGESLSQLKQAAKSFASKIADMSSDEAPNRLGVVSFASSGYRNFALRDLTPSTLDNIEREIDGFVTQGGGSRYGDGMKTAYDNVLKNKVRDEAQPIVIVIGDGDAGGAETIFIPSFSGGDIANETIYYAGLIKKSKEDGGLGGIVYSIGVFNGADENDNPPTPKDNSHWNNVFLQEVSSNYPEASAWDNCGTRADDAKYYLAGQNYSELEGLLDQIASDVREMGVTSPTETTDGIGSQSGYITFTDTLGDYMEVKGDEMKVVYAGQPFTGTRQSDGSFVFSDKVDGNPVYQDADMANLIVKVAPGENGAGDTVTVQIPAQLIPLRNYTVDAKDTDSVSMSTTDALPIRVFYNVGLKEGVEAKLAQPDEVMQTYINANTENGAVNFYSNDYTKDSETGNTTAEFTPAKTNKFYYFTERTPLYTDTECTQRATGQDVNGRVDAVYYKNAFYEQVGDTETGKAQEKGIKIPTDVFKNQHAENWYYDSEGAYMKAGSPRLNRTNDFNVDKGKDGVGSNATNTAKKFISPSWNKTEDGIIVSLGNNGKLAVERPATLSVSKMVEAADGFEAEDYYNTEFQFKVTFTGVEDGTYSVAVKDLDGNAVDGAITRVTVEDGEADFSLKHGQALSIFGLPGNAGYTVEETAKPGFTSSFEGAQGNLRAGELASAKFTNTYQADPVKFSTENIVVVEKEIDGRTWREGDMFTFSIAGQEGAPAPDKSTVVIKGSDTEKTGTFGNMTFTAPDTYVYYVRERQVTGEEALPGIDYSRALYRVTVVVDDDTNTGDLVIGERKVEKILDDKGASVDSDKQIVSTESPAKVLFTNSYDGKTQTITPEVIKDYKDEFGNKPLSDGMFTAEIKAKRCYKTDDPSASSVDAPAIPMPEVTKAPNNDTRFAFTPITYTSEHVGYTFEYEVAEVVEESAKIKGMEYDLNPHTVKVVVTESKDPETGKAVISVKPDPAEGVTIKNTFDPTPAKLPSEGDQAIHGTKTMLGRAMKEGEFTFTLKPTGNTLTAIANGAVEGIDAEGLTTSVKAGKKGTPVTFDFGTLEQPVVFKKVGTYRFEMREVVPADKDKAVNVEYDKHPCYVNVKVELGKDTGDLNAAVLYEGQGQNNFTNTYTSSGTYGELADDGLDVSKTMVGRAMGNGEFTFSITGAKSEKVSAEEATGKLDAADKTFSNERRASGEPWSPKKLAGVKFNQDDAGKTFSYIVDEVEPTDEQGAAAVTYDKSQYRVDIAVSDDGKGKLSAETTITKVMDARGEEVTESAQKVAFTNTYDPGSAVLSGDDVLAVTKKVEGRATNEAFSFKLELTGGDAGGVQGLGDGGTLTAATNGEIADGGEQKVLFGEDGAISFSKPDTYTFSVAEIEPTGENDGWNWDIKPRTITVEVKNQDAEGVYLDTLKATITGNNPTITNTYKTSALVLEDKSALGVTKTVKGLEGDETAMFNFTLEAPEGVKVAEGANKASVTVDANGSMSATFGAVTFEKPGVYTFEVTEDEAQADVNTWPKGWTYDKSTQEIVVEVIDNGEGELVLKNTPARAGFLNAVLGKSVSAEEGASADAPKVGDVLTYTIEWANTTGKQAKVVIVDNLPDGLEYVADSVAEGEAIYVADTNTLTVDLGMKDHGASGSVSFKVKVTEAAITGSIANKATINIGEGDVTVHTNTTGGAVETGKLTISKTIQVDESQGITPNTDQQFTFMVTLEDAAGKALTQEYAYSGATQSADKVKSGDTVTLKHNESITIEGLPAGASYEVSETNVPDCYDAKSENATGSIPSNDVAKAAFTNVYTASAATGVPADFELTKVFEGHEWTEDYAFEFKLTAVTDGAPMPTDAEGNTADTVTVKAPTEGDGKTAKFDFGSIEYKTAGTYEYEVNEIPGSNAGIDYARNTAKVKVTVSDNHNGGLVASANVENGTFSNTYKTGNVSIDDVAGGGLQIVKKLTGRSIAKDQFTFKMTSDNDASIAKLGGKPLEFKTAGATIEGDTATETIKAKTGLVFTKDDAGKIYTYTIAEVAGDTGEGYTYDPKSYTVAFNVTDGGEGVLMVEVSVGDTVVATYTGATQARAEQVPAVVTFNNIYDAGSATIGGEGDTAFRGTKTLTGRDMVAGEFKFLVKDDKGNTIDSATGANAADGTVTFGAITYTTASLNQAVVDGIATRQTTDGIDVYTFDYTVVEDQKSFDEGVTAVKSSGTVTVKVTDDGKGHLTAAVEGNKDLTFKNAYGANETATANINGTKTLKVESGDNAPDIDGKYEFTISAPEGTPLPTPATVKNVSGSVDFGEIVYTMENVFGDTGKTSDEPVVDEETGEAIEVEPLSAKREKAFTYTIKETGGQVDGVTNDTEPKTVTVTVTDNGDGTLSAEKSTPADKTDFTFTNTYKVTPTEPVSPTDPEEQGGGGIAITKNLTGRDLIAEEFTFELVDENDKVVSTGKNDETGNVTLPGITFNAPDTYKYKLREVVPEGDRAGVTYDGKTYAIEATVTDNGNGTLSVKWSGSKEIVFNNTYEAAPTSVTLGAAKVLEGAEIADKQFTFQVLDKSGRVFREAKNNATGSVTFPTIEFTQAGTYTYTLVEVDDGQEGVTYDGTKHEVVVTVTDNGKGNLVAEVGGAEGAVFKNAYKAPAEPTPAPEEPKDKLPVTGDDTLVTVGGVAAAAAALIGGGFVLRKKRG